MTLANKLTLARAGLGILTFGCLWTLRPNYFTAALILYIAATITDFIDGWVARRTGSVSPFGAMADPVADKVLVIGTLIAFLRIRHLNIPHWAVYLIIVRELVIGGLRTLAGAQGKILIAEQWGKWKMGIQSASVLIILALLVLQDAAKIPMPPWTEPIPAYLVFVCLFVTWASALMYLRQHRKLLQKSWEGPSDA